MMWKLDEEFLTGTQYSLHKGVEVSNITIGPINETVTTLSCYVKRKHKPQMMKVIQIRAGCKCPLVLQSKGHGAGGIFDIRGHSF